MAIPVAVYGAIVGAAKLGALFTRVATPNNVATLGSSTATAAGYAAQAGDSVSNWWNGTEETAPPATEATTVANLACNAPCNVP